MLEFDVLASVEEEEQGKDDDQKEEDADHHGNRGGGVVALFALDTGVGSVSICTGGKE